MSVRERVAQLLSEMPREPQYPSQGATLFVDLERQTVERAYTPRAVVRGLLAGRGANMFYLFRLLDESRAPLDPEIPLIFGAGVLTGLVPSAARGNATSWSPESGVLMDSNCGDYFPSFMKMNGIDDRRIIDELYAASEAGCQIDLIVRSICCLRPGVPGLSENIRVRSLVGRFLEHSRLFSFGDGEARPATYWMGSADPRTRNLDRRVEVVVEVEEEPLQERIREILDINLSDDRFGWELRADGSWGRCEPLAGRSAHDRFMELALERSHGAPKSPLEPTEGTVAG
mgnify:CR=1 FL=1